jgi:ABC-type cobalt transport system, permease component CbiQ and related transporters
MQVVIGQYIPANSWVHRLDPRTKLVGLILLIVSTFLIQELITMLSLLFVVLVLFASSKIPLKRFFRGIAPLLFLLTFTVIFQLLLNRQGELLYQRTAYLGWQQALMTLIVIVVYQLLKRVTRYRFAMFVLSLVIIFIVFSWSLLVLG